MFGRLLCLILGHKKYTMVTYTELVRKVGCRRCSAMWGVNDSVRTLPWSASTKELCDRSLREALDKKRA